MDRSFKKIKEVQKPDSKSEIIKAGYYDKLTRPFVLLLLKILVYTPITANQVSILMLFSGLIGAFLIGFPDWTLVGGIILQFAILLDGVDGCLARLKNQQSKYGIYIDGMFHNLTMPLLFFMLGVYSYKYFNNILFIFLGVGIVFSMMASLYSFYLRMYLLATKKKISIAQKQQMLAARFRKNIFQKIIGQTIVTINRFTYIFTLVLIAKIFDFLQYLIFFYFPFYVLVMIIKIFMEFGIAQKELS